MRRLALIPALILLPTPPAEARQMRTLSPREMAIYAETIVLAEPAGEPGDLTHYKVREAMRGSGLKPGDVFTLDPVSHDLRVYDATREPALQAKPPAVVQALLFLGPNRGTREQPRYQPVASGVRLWTEEGTLLVPVQVRNPGLYWLTPRRDADWGELVRMARADGATMQDLSARLKLQPAGRRNRALLEWVRRHRHEFGAPTGPESSLKTTQGWGYLEAQVFQTVLDSCEPADAWSAVKLFAEINRGTVPPLHEPAFGTPEGRALLLRLATAGDVLEGDRVRALALLSHPFTLWAGPLERLPQVNPLDAKEQEGLLDRLIPLLTSKSAPLRAAAARAIRCVSYPGVLPDEHPKSRRALPALEKAFRLEYPGEARDEIAEAVCIIGGPKHWQEFSGNPPGMVVCLRDLGRRDGQVHFWLSLRPCGQVVHECPSMVLERINQSGAALETIRLPLPVVNLPKPWDEGWAGDVPLLVQFKEADVGVVPFAATPLKPGTWRVSVQGTAGKDGDKMKWASEPKTFVIEAPRKDEGGPQAPFGVAW